MSTSPTKASTETLRPVVTTRHLTIAQRWLLRVMTERQFGRIENLRIENGMPAPDEKVRVIRSISLKSDAFAPAVATISDYELGKAERNLFDQLEQVDVGVVARLEFRHGSPTQIEMQLNADFFTLVVRQAGSKGPGTLRRG